MTNKQKRGLGRGLTSLMADIDPSPVPTDPSAAPKKEGNAQSRERQIPIEKIQPNLNQPRKSFDDERLNELAASIKERGIIQPVIVRPMAGTVDEFQLVAGERRWRAAQRAGLHEMPVIIREMDEREVLEVAIIENIQREDLNPIEEAESYRQLLESYGYTQQQLSNSLGKSRSHIANLLRLLSLPEQVLDLIKAGRLSMGHARALVPSENALALAQMVIARGLSVREVENLMKRPKSQIDAMSGKAKSAKAQDTLELEKNLSLALNLKVQIDDKGGKGVMKLTYKDLDQLHHLILRLTGEELP